MADLATDEILENYKGLLIQYCQERGLSQATYSETQHGPADAPCWQVKVSYGDWVHETPEPIPGTKKFAHQAAAQQALAEIDSRRENFLAGDVVDNITALPVSDSAPALIPLEVPMSLVSSVAIANDCERTAHGHRNRHDTECIAVCDFVGAPFFLQNRMPNLRRNFLN